MIKQTKVWLVLSITLSLALASACGGGGTNKAEPPANATAAAGPYSGPTGSVSGVISFDGTPAAPGKSIRPPTRSAVKRTRTSRRTIPS